MNVSDPFSSDTGSSAPDLNTWLARIQQLHPQEIDLGLDRLRPVARRLGLAGEGLVGESVVGESSPKLAPVIITVTGTNGKGSHVATLDAVSRALGYRVGSYTSPHLLRYNERVTINGQQVSDEALICAFEQIEQARENISLSYFEFGTLAAFLIFQQAELDVVILEVGLGGRLDAVNLVDADVAVVASIDLDHQEWLGDTREAIALEKAGIFRAGKPAVCAEAEPPSTLFEAAYALSCPLYLPGRDYMYEELSDVSWRWQGKVSDASGAGTQLVLDDLPVPSLSLANVASALQALCLSGLVRDTNVLRQCLPEVLSALRLQGRQQWISTELAAAFTPAAILLDVAHNPHAAGALAATLNRWRQRQPQESGKVRVVLAMMADKDHEGFYRALEKEVDFWYIAHFELPRCMSSTVLTEKLAALSGSSAAGSPGTPVFQTFATVPQAFSRACEDASGKDVIVVVGSFVTVSEVMAVLAGDIGQRD